MKILLIDADSKIPNIPLMKLSTYHKNKGDFVELVKLNLPFFPNKKKRYYDIQDILYDKVYCSIVFEGNRPYINGKAIFGGTGVDLTTILPEEIENQECDYSIYPDNDTSYGFITRGCIRNCKFCKVPKKEGYIHKVNDIDDIVRHKKVKFFDNNILAYPGHKEILAELGDREIKCCFNQGLDIRLVDSENSKLLSKLKYLGEYVFAFDDWSYLKIIEKKLPILEKWSREWQLKFFVYVHPDMPIEDTLSRIMWLKERKCLAYMMRDITCWESEFSKFYIDISTYCNRVSSFKPLNFEQFLKNEHSRNKNIVDYSLRLWNRYMPKEFRHVDKNVKEI